MEGKLLTVHRWPRAILHVDADAFFTSVEQARDPSLRGRPVVTGGERGVITCASYEAKALGIRRGVSLREARAICPELVVLSSDYEAYGLYSSRIFRIMERYTPWVEVYSIDEAFADLTGMRAVHRCGYREMAEAIRRDVRAELGITVSAGVSLSKSLAKICSSFRKPDGLTAVEGRFLHLLLERTPVGAVWGLGPNRVRRLEKFGVRTAYDYVRRPEGWIRKYFFRPGVEIWRELRGESVWPVNPEAPAPRVSIQRSQTFTPPSGRREVVYARLVQNVEAAFERARRHRLRPRRLRIFLRRSDFVQEGGEAVLNRPTASTAEALPRIRELFGAVWRPGVRYRATGIVLDRLESDTDDQLDLFEDPLKIESFRRLSAVVDAINRKYGRGTLHSAAVLAAREPSAGRPPRRPGLPVLNLKV